MSSNYCLRLFQFGIAVLGLKMNLNGSGNRWGGRGFAAANSRLLSLE